MAEYNIGKKTVQTGKDNCNKPQYGEVGETAKGLVLHEGDVLNVKEGGTVIESTLDGGIVNGYKNGTIEDSIFKSGTAQIDGATVINGTMTGGYLTVSSGLLLGTFHVSGGQLYLAGSSRPDGKNNPRIYLSGSASAIISNAQEMSIVLQDHATIVVTRDALKNISINASGEDFGIMINGLDVKTITGVTKGDRAFIIHTTQGDVTIDGYIPTYKFMANGKDNVWLRACFAAGTLVSTPIGYRTVEALKIGDMVDTDLGPQAVQWVGHQDVNLHGATPDEAHLVRIRAHAFGPQSPSRDLWVTSEHCVQNAEGLTPIRMLVNGGSIAYDRQKRRFTYYHIEVANHAILQAENLGMESYLPGSNASLFENGHDESLVVSVMRDGVVRLPLIIDRERVEPLWARLALRSRETGFPVLPFEGTVGSTDFSLMTDKGEMLDRVDHAVPGQAAFLLPPETKHVRIFSHAVRPDQVIGPFVDDRRLLGLRVGAAYLQGELEDTKVTDHLKAGILGGWNNIESDDWRWTSDEALLPLPSVAQSGGALRLVLELPDVR